MLANVAPFSSSASFFAAEVWPLKNVVQLVMIAADSPEFTLGVLVVVAAVVAVGIGVVVVEVGVFEDPHAASRIDATAIPPSASAIRDLSKRAHFSAAPVDVMVTIIASRSLLAKVSLRKTVDATSLRRADSRGALLLFVGRVTERFPTVGFVAVRGGLEQRSRGT